MVEKVAERLLEEMKADAHAETSPGKPLRWLLHGGPGTGKSHVIKIIKERFFRDFLNWDMGVEYQIVALWAVMAELLDGDTIHHACGIPAFRRKECHSEIYSNT